jgi:hypothetical protein
MRGRNRELAARAAQARTKLSDSIRREGQDAVFSIEALLVAAFLILAASGSGEPYDSSAYDGEREARRIRCQRQCMNNAYAGTSTAPGLAGAYSACSMGC